MPRLPPPVVEDAEGWWLCHVAKQDSLLGLCLAVAYLSCA